MARQLVSFCLALFLIASWPAADAGAVELPVRKAGLWEMKVSHTNSPAPEMTMQHCTDETTDKEMSTSFSPMAKDVCSKQDIQKTATGYVSDSVCGIPGRGLLDVLLRAHVQKTATGYVSDSVCGIADI